MAEIQGIQNVSTSDISSNVSSFNTDSIDLKNEEQIKMKVSEESSSGEEQVAVDLSTAIDARSVEANALPNLMNISANTSFVSKSEFMEAKLKAQVAEAKIEAGTSIESLSAAM